jgi:hypothetical protein
VSSDLLSAQRAVFMSALTSTEKLVLLGVLAHWSRTGDQPFPGVDRIARWTSFGRRAVIEAVKSLETKGALLVTRRPGLPNTYDVSRVFAGGLPVQDDHQCTTITSAPDAPDPCTTITGPVHDVHPTRAPRAPEGIHRRDPVKGSSEGIQGEASQSSAPLNLEPSDSTTRKAAGRKKTSKRWRCVPADWQPTDEHRSFARQQGVDFDLELRKFRNHEFPRYYEDANAKFIVWLTGAIERARQDRNRGNSRSGQPRQPSHDGPWRAADHEHHDDEEKACT